MTFFLGVGLSSSAETVVLKIVSVPGTGRCSRSDVPKEHCGYHSAMVDTGPTHFLFTIHEDGRWFTGGVSCLVGNSREVRSEGYSR